MVQNAARKEGIACKDYLTSPQRHSTAVPHKSFDLLVVFQLFSLHSTNSFLLFS